MESVGDVANRVFHEDLTFFKSVTFGSFGKCSESVGFDANNDLQGDFKFFISDTFENYKSFVPVDVHSHYGHRRYSPTSDLTAYFNS